METSYDQTKYESYSYNQTHPDNLYSLARLFGLEAPNIENARILELGCASGGNIIPMASNLKKAKFVGIDLSTSQIDDGLKMIKALKLKNIELKSMSIMDIDEDFGKFDYIICHGIFSWVNEEVQEKILSIFDKNLSEDGVAYLSYNTFPGWGAVKSIRDMMLYHTINIEDPAQKAAQARALLQFIAEGLEGENSSYADFMKTEISMLKKQPDSYLLHDHLEEENNPAYFYQVCERAAKHQMAYLGDAELATMFVGNLPEMFANELSKINNIVLTNQYMDFVRNTRFRCTLFSHANKAVSRNLEPKLIESFKLSVKLIEHTPLVEENLAQGVEMTFKSPLVTFRSKSNVAKTAMKILVESKRPMAFDDLVEQISKTSNESDAEKIKDELHNSVNLIRLALGGLLRIHSFVGTYVDESGDKPKTTPLVLEQVKTRNIVTNQRHETIGLNQIERIMIQWFDGKTDRSKIIKNLKKAIDEGKLQILDKDKNKLEDNDTINSHLSEMVNRSVEQFIKNALIIK